MICYGYGFGWPGTPEEQSPWRRVNGLLNTAAWSSKDVDVALTDQLMAEQLTRDDGADA